jgi:hypothetical protein
MWEFKAKLSRVFQSITVKHTTVMQCKGGKMMRQAKNSVRSPYPKFVQNN